MRYLIITLVTLLVGIAAASVDEAESTFNLRHRDLANKVICFDLGKQRGMHNVGITKAKYFRKLTRYNNASAGKCTVPTKSFKKSLLHKHDFCKDFNEDHVTIRAPEGLRKWMIKEAGATDGACSTEDNFVEIFEVN
ncbi:hypothetical protein HJC23_013711 [Cyclotella cryptica]|uniref:Uncharacterized protein n=1 Tax=Cyclotella cryptica TaxID=29204 RepID=A0ABD3QUJ8_9STRA|eukprot:CCRYP_001582-RA/>CCRYP_001582-RA protein AED:0.45 eAED:0.45 QI:0/-1/0/1/-1/1/1/0/136